MQNIRFFNNFHNGDLFAAKGYVFEIIQHFKNAATVHVNFEYIHRNHKKVLSDLPVKYIKYDEKYANHPIQNHIIYQENDNIFYINTWIGHHLFNECNKPGASFRGLGCNWRVYHEMFSLIYENINNEFFVKRKLLTRPLLINPNLNYYFPQIFYSFFELDSIHDFMSKIDQNKPKVLISNGKALSGQLDGIAEMNSVYEQIVKNFPDYNFLFTRKFEFESSNLFFTDTIINSKITDFAEYNHGNQTVCDLNEIAYLSTYCEYIVGSNSGPFIFSHTKQNILNKNKKFLSFGNNEYDCLQSRLDVPSQYKFLYKPDENTFFSESMNFLLL